MAKDLNLRLEAYFLAFIEEMVVIGRFSSPSQVVDAALWLLERRGARPYTLATALQEGEASGLAEDFDLDELLVRKNAQFAEGEQPPTPKEINVHIETDFLAFIEEMVASGRFGSSIHVVQAGLRLLEERESHGKALRAAIEEGEDSGWIEAFNLDEFLAEMHKEAAARKASDAP